MSRNYEAKLAYMRQRYAADPERFKAATRKHYVANRDAVNARQRGYKLKHKFGLTRANYDAMVAQQGGRCAICEKEDGDLNVDHDHDTGKVRELLCTRCNVALAHIEHPLRAQWDAYVERHRD